MFIYTFLDWPKAKGKKKIKVLPTSSLTLSSFLLMPHPTPPLPTLAHLMHLFAFVHARNLRTNISGS
jgi:hypothetical protein